MECKAYRILMSGYIDGELSESEMQKLKAHLQSCAFCVNYLRDLENMQASLKRYTTFREMPKISPDFAAKVTAQIQEINASQQIKLADRLKAGYRSFALNFVERWSASLKIRPFAWATTISCGLILLAGGTFFEALQYLPLKQPVQFVAVAPESTISSSKASVSSIEEAGDFIEFSPTDDTTLVPLDTTENSMPDMIQFAETAEQSFVRVAQNDAALVEDYVYSHVVEVYQDHFVGDAMLVGYTQDAFTE